MSVKVKENWEIELDENLESIKKSYKSIRRDYYILMGIMLTWVISSIIGMIT